jgi:hypothetical protein
MQHGRIMLSVALLCVMSWTNGLGGTRIGVRQSPSEVIPLPRTDCAFSGIGAVHVGGSVLLFYLLQCDECFDIMGCFIVYFVEEGPISPDR